MTIHTVDMIDEVLKFALENEKSADVLEMPPLFNDNQAPSDISAGIE